MRRILIVLFIIPVFLSCAKKTKLPKGILPQVKMQAVMWDLMQAGEFLNGYVLYRDTGVNHAAQSQKWFNKVCEIHRISKKDFENSYAYYRQHPPLMRELLDSLAKKPAPVLADSLAKFGQGPRPLVDSVKKKAPVIMPGMRRNMLDSMRRKRRMLLPKKTIPDSVS